MINSIAFSTVRRPLAEEIAIGRFIPTGPGGEAPRAVAPRLAAALAVRTVRRFRWFDRVWESVSFLMVRAAALPTDVLPLGPS